MACLRRPREGVLGTIPAPKDEVRIALFGSTKPNERFTGSENYYNTFQFGTDRLRIRYQRTEKVCKFYVRRHPFRSSAPLSIIRLCISS